MLTIFPSSSLFMDSLCDNTVHLHSPESLHLLAFCFDRHFLTPYESQGIMRTAIHQEPRHHCNFHHLLQHPHRADLQSRLKYGHVSRVAPDHHLQYFLICTFQPATRRDNQRIRRRSTLVSRPIRCDHCRGKSRHFDCFQFFWC